MGCFCAQFLEPGAFYTGLVFVPKPFLPQGVFPATLHAPGAAARMWGAPGRGTRVCFREAAPPGSRFRLPSSGRRSFLPGRPLQAVAPRRLPSTGKLFAWPCACCYCLRNLLMPAIDQGLAGLPGPHLALDPASKRYMLTEDSYCLCSGLLPQCCCPGPQTPQ